MNDLTYMKRALFLAEKGRGRTSPNPMVGCVIVKNRKIISEGWHRRYGGNHAEANALNQAGENAKGATMYVTLEPCNHFGKTPPCVDHVISSGIKKIVIAMKDPNRLTNGQSIRKLKKRGIITSVGLMEKEAKELNEVFIKYQLTGNPFIVAKTAQTLDGKIATKSGDSKWITSSQTRIAAKKLRNNFDAILIGVNTLINDDPLLDAPGKMEFKKIIVDSSLRSPLNATIFQGRSGGQCIIATTKRASQRKIHQFRKRGLRVDVLPEKNNKVNLKVLIKKLAEEKLLNVLIEGGAAIIGSAVKEKIVDQFHIYVAPKIIGDESSKASIIGLKINSIKNCMNLKIVHLDRINEDILIKAVPIYKGK